MEDFNNSLTNHSNSSIFRYCKYWKPNTDLEEITKRTACLLIIVLGISANVFVIILAAKYTVRKNLHHLIINMAVGDTVFLFSWLLYYILRLNSLIYRNGRNYGIAICRFLRFLENISYKVTLITLLLISIQRFRATRRTLTRSPQYTFKKRMTVICVCWLIALPFAAYFAYEVCARSADGVFRYYVLAEEIVLVFLCCVIIFFSIITMRRLSRPQAIQSHLNEQQRKIRRRRAQSAVRMVLVSVLLYTCCWLPIFIFNTSTSVDFFIPTVGFIESVCIDWKTLNFILSVILPVVNSTFSPFIYLIFLPDFRHAAKTVLCRTVTHNQKQNTQNSVFPELQAMPDRLRFSCDVRRNTSDD